MIDGYSIAMWFAGRLIKYLLILCAVALTFIAVAFLVGMWVSKWFGL